MIKRILASFLTFVFVANFTCYAGEVIIIGSDGQARYENEALNVPRKTDSEATKNIKVDDKVINIKKIERNQKELVTYHNKFNKYSHIEKYFFEASKVNSNLKGYKYYDYNSVDNYSKNSNNIIRINLKDGDYALLNQSVKGNKKYKYAAEYHKNGELFGIVQIKTIKKSSKSITLTFNEYRFSENLRRIDLKHVMFLDVVKDNSNFKVVQFIYLYDTSFDSLLCAQIDKDLYLTDESRNLIVQMKKFEVPETIQDLKKQNDEKVTKKKESRKSFKFGDTISEIVGVTFAVVGFIVALPLIIWFLNDFSPY